MPSASAAKSHDIAIIGGGIVGLWTAFEAARQGRSVVLVEKRRVGAGASGGLLGALMPHQPTGWNAKKQFQLDGLLTLEDEIAVLQETTGLTAGSARGGRLMPIRNAEKRRQSGQWAEASHDVWPYPFRWQVAEATIHSRWMPAQQMPFGANFDNLSARIDPRALVSALKKALEMAGVTIREMCEVTAIGPDGWLALAQDDELAAERVVVAAGWEAFGLVDGAFGEPVGGGVKGQAALLRPAEPVDPASPILYDDGTYVIAHDSGLLAVGSTSENEFGDPDTTDEKLDTVIGRARDISPALEGAEIVERWAGVRPKAAGREPLVGPLPGFDTVLIATGGYKISFAIAHLIARAVLMQADGKDPGFLPDEFRPESRLKPRLRQAP